MSEQQEADVILRSVMERVMKRPEVQEAIERAEFAEPEQIAAQSYPVELFKDTLAGEFAERCCKGNLIPSELFIEAFITVLCAVVGDRVYGDHKGMRALQYLLLVAPPQNGKDVAIGEAEDVFRAADGEFDGTTFYTHDKPAFNHLGAKSFNPASEVSIINAGLVCPRLLATPPEFGSLFEKSGIPGSGNSLLETFLGSWDSKWAKFSTAKKRDVVPSLLHLGLLTSIQPDRLSGMPVSSGLYSRIIWLTYPPLNIVASLPEVDYGNFQKRLFARLLPLENAAVRITTSPEAGSVLNEWFLSVKLRNYEDPQIFARINIIALRRALILAWLRNETTITPELMGGVCRWCDWQLGIRAELFLQETDNAVASHQAKIRKALKRKPGQSHRELFRATSGHRVGTVIFNQALNGLVITNQIKAVQSARRNSLVYGLPKEEAQ